MHYLKCIALLSFMLKKLNAGQRASVPISAVDEVQTGMVSIQTLLGGEKDPEVSNRINDVMASTLIIKQTQGLVNLSDDMKNTLIQGVTELKDMISLLAFDYFKVHDFEPTKQLIPVLRTVVKTALEKGVI